jgi:hypothetical protein
MMPIRRAELDITKYCTRLLADRAPIWRLWCWFEVGLPAVLAFGEKITFWYIPFNVSAASLLASVLHRGRRKRLFSADGFPFGFRLLQLGMGYEEMLHYGLKSFGVRRGVDGIHSWNDDTGVGDTSSETAIAAHNAQNGGTGGFGVFDGPDQIGADVLLKIPPAD